MATTSARMIRPASRLPVAVATAGIALVLFLVYALFDLREGGARASLTTTEITRPTHYATFMKGGALWLAGMYVLDAVLAVVAAFLLVQSIRAIRQRLGGGEVGTCSIGSTVLLGFATFACPACPLPILGSLGVFFLASTLPLGGLEFKLLAILIVVAALVWSRRRMAAPQLSSPERRR